MQSPELEISTTPSHCLFILAFLFSNLMNTCHWCLWTVDAVATTCASADSMLGYTNYFLLSSFPFSYFRKGCWWQPSQFSSLRWTVIESPENGNHLEIRVLLCKLKKRWVFIWITFLKRRRISLCFSMCLLIEG